MQRRVLLSCLFLSACSGGLEDNEDFEAQAQVQVVGTKTPMTYYQNIKPIIDQKCTTCHADGEAGHFSLQTYAAVKPLVTVIKTFVSDASMPPWPASASSLNYFVGDRRLSDKEKQNIVGWIEQGAPEGTPTGATSATVAKPPGLTSVGLTLQMPDPYTPKPAQDDYRCFLLPWTADATKPITGVNFVPTDKELVQSAWLHLVSPEAVEPLYARDSADTEAGWPCMSGPSGSTWIASLEPGGSAKMVPGNLGIPVKAGAALVLQVHYNTLHKGGTDQTKIELALGSSSTKAALPTLLADPKWSAKGLPIAANTTDVIYRWQGRPASVPRDTAYDLYSVDLHMHSLGVKGSIGIVRANQTTETLLEIPAYSYDWQQTYRLTKPVQLATGDNLFVECHYTNTEDKQPVLDGVRTPVRELNWGEKPTDEICLGNVLLAKVGSATATNNGTNNGTGNNGTVNNGTGTNNRPPATNGNGSNNNGSTGTVRPGNNNNGSNNNNNGSNNNGTGSNNRPPANNGSNGSNNNNNNGNTGSGRANPTPTTPRGNPSTSTSRPENCSSGSSGSSGGTVGGVERTVRTGSGSTVGAVSRCN